MLRRKSPMASTEGMAASGLGPRVDWKDVGKGDDSGLLFGFARFHAQVLLQPFLPWARPSHPLVSGFRDRRPTRRLKQSTCGAEQDRTGFFCSFGPAFALGPSP